MPVLLCRSPWMTPEMLAVLNAELARIGHRIEPCVIDGQDELAVVPVDVPPVQPSNVALPTADATPTVVPKTKFSKSGGGRDTA